MSAFAELSAVYHDRGKLASAAAPGKKVVGLVGATIPVELVLAADAVAIAVAAEPSVATAAADRYLEAHFDDEVRATLDDLLSGAYESLDLLVLARTSDTYLELFYVLKELTRLGHGPRLPALHLYDLLHARSEPNRTYGLARLRELAARLEALTGRPITDPGLRAAARLTNQQRAAVNRLHEARHDLSSGITGVDAMTAIGAGRFMDRARHAALLDAYLAEPRTPLSGRPRVLLIAGVALSNLRLHQAIEQAGAVVVAEDDPWGSRAGGRLIADAPDGMLESIFDKYFVDVPSPHLGPASARDEWLVQELERHRPDALIVFIPRSDHWFGWDYPRLRSLAAASGVPTLLMRDLDSAAVSGFVAQAART